MSFTTTRENPESRPGPQPQRIDAIETFTEKGLGELRSWFEQQQQPKLPIFTGTGTPEGSVKASKGALFLRRDGSAGTCLYVKESGVDTTTGWVGK